MTSSLVSTSHGEESAGRNHVPELVLVMIDVINPFDFPAGPSLFRRALPAARANLD